MPLGAGPFSPTIGFAIGGWPLFLRPCGVALRGLDHWRGATEAIAPVGPGGATGDQATIKESAILDAAAWRA